MTPTRRGVVAGGLAATLSGARAPTRKGPRAIAMWDFSWLERRWPGAGYEDPGVALNELTARGYDAVRIDAFPHLMLAGPEKARTLHAWSDHAWGSPGRVTVRIMPALTDFIAACARRGIKVALSSWYRQDDADLRMGLADPRRMIDAWTLTLQAIERAGLLEAILYVDFCNEWPGPLWAAFLTPPLDWGAWPDPRALAYAETTLTGLRAAYPAMPFCFSADRDRIEDYGEIALPYLDLIEHHVWMGKEQNKAFEAAIARATPEGVWLDRVAQTAPSLYRGDRARWDTLLTAKIARLARISRMTGKPLVTTEGWAMVSLLDWPMLEWGWVKEICEVGVQAALASGRYLAIATSNFCGPQIAGMWRDVAWHRRLTRLIKNTPIDSDLQASTLYARL